jgi:hypothetical protein
MQPHLTYLVTWCKKFIHVLYLSFNFQHLDLYVFLFGFDIKIPTHVMKPWKFFHIEILWAIWYPWNQKVFKYMNVNINEILVIVKYQVFQFIKVHHYICQQSSSKKQEVSHKIKSTFVDSKGLSIFLKYKRCFHFAS